MNNKKIASELVLVAKALLSGHGTVPAFSKFVKEFEVEDYPYGRHKTKATFKVEGTAKKQRVSRITIDPVRGVPNSPKATTYGPAAIIGIGAHDNHAYPIVGMPGQISIWSGDMKHTVASVFTDDAAYKEIAEALGFRTGPDKITIKDTPDGVEINGLQGKPTTLRDIMNTAGLTNEVINAEVQNVHRSVAKDMMKNTYTVNFKAELNKKPFVIEVHT